MRSGRRIHIEARALDGGGRGVGRAEGREVSVFDLLPGERAEVEIEHVSPHAPRAWAGVVRREGPASAERVQPACPAFGRCGGCPLQHLAYSAQLAEKRRRVSSALSGVLGDAAPAVATSVPSPHTLGYRCRAKYVAAGRRGALVLGAYLPRTHRVVETLGCRVVEARIDAAAAAARDALAASGLAPYDERTQSGELRYVVARSGAEGEVLIGVVTPSRVSERSLEPVARELASLEGIAGVAWIRNDTRTGAIFSGEVRVLSGSAEVLEEVGPARVGIDITTFSQVNREQARALYRAAAELAEIGPGARVAELYCGTGGIALHLGEAGAKVLGIERHEPAVATARRAAALRELSDRVHFAAGDAACAAELEPRADAVVVDPPRKGLAPEARAALASMRPGVLVYVSCNPDTFARDSAELAERGYALEHVEPWDLMPGTPHVELLARFRAS